MREKIAALVACALMFFGCGLHTAGQGPGDDDDQSPSDVLDEDSEPDIAEDEAAPPDLTEDRFDLAEGDVLDEGDEAVSEDSEMEDTEPEDAVWPDESEDGDEEDFVDPCAPPEIPTVGLYLWFCIPDPVRTVLTVARWVDRSSEPDISWGYEPGCSTRDTYFLLCELSDYGPGIWYFNVVMPGIGVGWSCGPGLEVNHGLPRIWNNGWELEVGVADNGYGGCNHTFEVPPL